jgi:D-tyrosyl-tRNA(Tyr) deacylase
MKVVLQRVSRASVTVDEEVVGEIGAGLLVLLGVMTGDTPKECTKLVEKVGRFRCFADEAGRMNLSALDLQLEVLLVSQFTLAADGKRGRRPSFDRAAEPAVAERLYLSFAEGLRELGLPCATGTFGAMMEVSLVNQGPATFVLEEAPSSGPLRSI